jgi:hypothetical protein
MEKLLATLSRPHHVEILEQLLTDSWATQKEIAEELGIGKAATSQAVNSLIRARLVKRDRPRGPCFIPESKKVGDLLQLAADLDAQLAKEEAEEKQGRAKSLRKGRMKANTELLAQKAVAEMGDPGFEPGTSSLSETRSNQLS